MKKTFLFLFASIATATAYDLMFEFDENNLNKKSHTSEVTQVQNDTENQNGQDIIEGSAFSNLSLGTPYDFSQKIVSPSTPTREGTEGGALSPYE